MANYTLRKARFSAKAKQIDKLGAQMATFFPSTVMSCHVVLVCLQQILLVRAECVRCPWAAGINIVATLYGIIFPLLSSSSDSLTFLPERRQVGFCNFAWAPK